MKPQSAASKRKQIVHSEEKDNKKFRKNNGESQGNQCGNASKSRHELLVDLIRSSRKTTEPRRQRRASSSSEDLKKKFIHQLEEDMKEIDVIDIRKKKLARMWSQKQELERKIDDNIQQQENFRQEELKSVELSLAMTAAKIQEMEMVHRSQTEKSLAALKECRDDNWKLMYMLYQSRQENEDLKTKLRNLYVRQKNQKSSSRKEKQSVFEERKIEVISNCTLVLICAYILYLLSYNTVQRLNPNQLTIEEMGPSLPGSQDDLEVDY